jgi:mono/diheme cytochrome c family protein
LAIKCAWTAADTYSRCTFAYRAVFIESNIMHQNKFVSIARRKIHLAAAFLLLSSWFAVGSAEAQAWKSRLSTDEPDVLYRHYCSACHGAKGDGKGLGEYVLKPPPENFTSKETREELSRAKMIEYVNKGTRKKGKPTAMISWKDHLSPKQIESVVDYVIVTFMDGKVASDDKVHATGHGHSAVRVTAVDYPYGLKANASRGKSIYSANCQSCHGEKGDGRGNPAQMGSINPRNFHDADFVEFASGFSLFSAISGGRGHMPAWEKTLPNQDIADVSEYVLRTYSKPRPTASRAK